MNKTGETESKTATAISQHLIQVVRDRLRDDKRVRRTLPLGGRIAIDRQLPFLCVYRRPVAGVDEGTDRFATSEASYLICSGRKKQQAGVTDLVAAVAETMVAEFGAFLLLELWSGPSVETEGPVTTAELTPKFRVVTQRGAADESMLDEFDAALSRIKLGKRSALVSTGSGRCAPPGMRPILDPESATRIGCQVYGLEITPIHRDPSNGNLFPHVLRTLGRKLTVALRRAFFEFVRAQTGDRPLHYHTLGRRAVVNAVWEVDQMLADASEQFDFLLQVTPVNVEKAWREFKRARFDRPPTFHYRPLPAEPVVLKRNLYRAPVERIEDPALGMIFREKIDDIDRQITMLQERNTRRFLHESIQAYGGIEPELDALATRILNRIPARTREGASGRKVSADEFAQRAREEIEHFRGLLPAMSSRVELRSDVSGLMVSNGNLLVSTALGIPSSRVEALIQHEVGTHVLTYHNGRAQKLRLLYVGLAGYEALQEGLAVLAEYLVGGLSRPRLRMLAARVVAARMMVDGASFVETFREIDRTYDFDRRTAYGITMRTYRGGGLTKDVIYLRGLRQILDYLGGGGDLAPLFVGKIAAQHIPIVRELQWRGVLGEPPLTPRYMSQPDALKRLEGLGDGLSVTDLVERRANENRISRQRGQHRKGGIHHDPSGA